MNKLSITVGDDTWTATYNPAEYGVGIMRKAFWLEQHHGKYGLQGGGPMYGVTNKEEALAYLYGEALRKLRCWE